MNCANHSDIAAVAFCRTCGKPLCQTCTRDVRGVIYCESCLAARLDGTAPAAGFVPPAQTVYPPGGPAYVQPGAASSGPNPTVAGILGAIPSWRRGCLLRPVRQRACLHGDRCPDDRFALPDISGIAHAALGIFQGFFWIYQIIDSVRTARAIQLGEPAPDPLGLVAMFGGNTGAPGTSTAGGVAPLANPRSSPSLPQS